VTLAFLTIINPALLYIGAALATIPVIIHLLNRLRYRRVIWAAMEFLLAAHRKNARRIRLEHLILLIIRTLIVLLLAAALGRPVLKGLLARMGRSAVHRVLVIDDSFSMAARYGVSAGEETVIKEARKTAEWLVKSFDERDGVSLVTAGSPGRADPPWQQDKITGSPPPPSTQDVPWPDPCRAGILAVHNPFDRSPPPAPWAPCPPGRVSRSQDTGGKDGRVAPALLGGRLTFRPPPGIALPTRRRDSLQWTMNRCVRDTARSCRMVSLKK